MLEVLLLFEPVAVIGLALLVEFTIVMLPVLGADALVVLTDPVGLAGRGIPWDSNVTSTVFVTVVDRIVKCVSSGASDAPECVDDDRRVARAVLEDRLVVVSREEPGSIVATLWTLKLVLVVRIVVVDVWLLGSEDGAPEAEMSPYS